jgi:hypothetical protein
MSGLFGFVRRSIAPDPARLDRMAAVLRRHSAQTFLATSHGPVDVGLLHRESAASLTWHARSRDGDLSLWVAGEVFSTRWPLPAAECPDAEWWQRTLLEAMATRGIQAIAGLNGDFHLALWDARSQRLSIAVDRFATSPLYWTVTPEGFAFGHGVRALVGERRETTPDLDAIREAVTFGGYRLGTRTNIAGIQMVRPAHAIHATPDGHTSESSYWTWHDVPASAVTNVDDAVDAVHAAWRRAVRRRLHNTHAPAQTLSGGRDSRAILAEAAPQCSSWQAITYGVTGCDDARYAAKAAAAAGVAWRFVPLYDRTAPDWLERRTAQVQHTDGLIDLIDLMHLENVHALTDGIDCQMPGYLGDVIVGTTYDRVDSYDRAMLALPFTGARIALPEDQARSCLEAASIWTPGTPGRALIFEHKFPQAIGRPNAALAAWTAVRRPFLDLDVADLALGFSDEIRAGLYDRWVRREYPTLFRIPIQKTGAPAGSSLLRLSMSRAGRVVRRRARAVAGILGWPVAPWSRTFTADEAQCSEAGIRERMESVILRPASIAVDVWGRAVLKTLLDDWFEGRGGSAQVIGALYTWEAYHRDLAGFVRERTREVAA